MIEAAERARIVFHGYAIAVVAVENYIEYVLRQVFQGRIHGKIVCLRQRAELHLRHVSRIPTAHFDCAVFERFVPIGDKQIDVDFVAETKPTALGACSVRVVEREKSRSQLFKRQLAIGAGVLCGIQHFFAVKIGNHKSFRELDCVFDCIRDTSLRAVLDNDTVDDNAYGVLDVFVKRNLLVKRVVHPVHAHAHVARAFKLFKLFAILALSSANDGSKQLQFCPFSLHDFVAYLIHRLTLNLSAAFRAMGSADSCKQKPQIVIDFRHRTHCGTRIVRSGFLIDGHSRRQPLDVVHVGFLHLPQKHTRIA